MFAIVESGGKQYRVAEGDVLRVEKLAAESGAEVDLPVLLLGGDDVRVGTPHVEGVRVVAEVIDHGRGPKIDIYKFKAKANYRRHRGHRQPYTDVRIARIEGAGGSSKSGSGKASAEKASADESAAKATDAKATDAKAADAKAAEAKATDGAEKSGAAKSASSSKSGSSKAKSSSAKSSAKTASKSAPSKKTSAKKPDTKKADTKAGPSKE